MKVRAGQFTQPQPEQADEEHHGVREGQRSQVVIGGHLHHGPTAQYDEGHEVPHRAHDDQHRRNIEQKALTQLVLHQLTLQALLLLGIVTELEELHQLVLALDLRVVVQELPLGVRQVSEQPQDVRHGPTVLQQAATQKGKGRLLAVTRMFNCRRYRYRLRRDRSRRCFSSTTL